MEDLPIQWVIPKHINFPLEEQAKIDKEISRFLEHEIIEKVNETSKSEYISIIFFRPKNQNHSYLKELEQKLSGKNSFQDWNTSIGHTLYEEKLLVWVCGPIWGILLHSCQRKRQAFFSVHSQWSKVPIYCFDHESDPLTPSIHKNSQTSVCRIDG